MTAENTFLQYVSGSQFLVVCYFNDSKKKLE